jgi:hypothetical protein
LGVCVADISEEAGRLVDEADRPDEGPRAAPDLGPILAAIFGAEQVTGAGAVEANLGGREMDVVALAFVGLCGADHPIGECGFWGRGAMSGSRRSAACEREHPRHQPWQNH